MIAILTIVHKKGPGIGGGGGVVGILVHVE